MSSSGILRRIRHGVRGSRCAGAMLLCWHLSSPSATRAETGADVSRVQHVVDAYLPRLGMTVQVEAVVVPRNALMVSVEPVGGVDRFRLSVEESFLLELSDDELNATVAHELGHVWIYTHHPFLQTEAGANDVAMQLVPRHTLERVYDKVYRRLGTRGAVVRFNGD